MFRMETKVELLLAQARATTSARAIFFRGPEKLRAFFLNFASQDVMLLQAGWVCDGVWDLARRGLKPPSD